MSWMPVDPTTPRAYRRAWLVPALALGLATAACKDDPVRVTDDVAGTWTAVSATGARQYLRIAADDIEVFSEDLLADCFERVLFTILEIDGDAFRITDQADTFSIELSRDGEDLRLSAFDVSLNYTRTSTDPSTLTQCSPPNPGVACADLAPLGISDTLEATLTEIDPANPDGSHYDLYRLQTDALTELVLKMISTQVDSYLYLFEDGGALLARNDDASSLTLDARIAITLDAGCYIVMASSAAPDDFGDYSLETSTP